MHEDCFYYSNDMSSQPNLSVADALRILAHVALAPQAVGCRACARDMEMDAVRCNRLLKSLAAGGYVQQDQQRRYRPGPAFQVFAAAALHASPLLRHGAALLEDCARRSGHTVALGMVWGDQVVYLWHGGRVGASAPYPAGDSSIGRVFSGDGASARSASLIHNGHRSLAVAVPHVAQTGLALTDIPLDAPLPPLRTILRHYAQALSEVSHA